MYSWERVKECRSYQCHSVMTVAPVPWGRGPMGIQRISQERVSLYFSTLTDSGYQCGIRAGTRDVHKERFLYYRNNKV